MNYKPSGDEKKNPKIITSPQGVKRETHTMTGGQSLIHSLYNEGVRIIFGLLGVQMYHAIIPILDYPDMKFIKNF